MSRAVALATPLALLAALAAGAAVVALPTRAAPPAVARWLPPDGHEFSLADGAESWARLDGPAALAAAPKVLFLALQSPAAAEAAFADPWARRAVTAGDETTWHHYWVRPEGIGLVGLVSRDGSVGFSPALPVLPADAAPGQDWAVDGLAVADGLQAPYRWRTTVTDGGDGCLRLAQELTLNPDAPGATPQTDEELWCPGRGVVREGEAPAPTLDVPPAAPAQVPARWTARSGRVHNIDGGGYVLGEVVAPLASDLVVGEQSNDALRLDAEARIVDHLHPGGRILAGTALSPAGGPVVLGTDRRELVAFTTDGRRAWTHPLTELPRSLARVGDGVLATAADGSVELLDAATGRRRWRSGTLLLTDRPPAVGDDLVVLAGRDGRLTALDAATGEPRWHDAADSRPFGVAVGHGLVVVVTVDGDVEAHEAASGELRWRRWAATGGGELGVVATADGFVAAGGAELVSFSPDGTRRWTRPHETNQLLSGPGWVGSVTDHGVELVGTDGSTATSPLVADASRRCAAVGAGITCLDMDGTLRRFEP